MHSLNSVIYLHALSRYVYARLCLEAGHNNDNRHSSCQKLLFILLNQGMPTLFNMRILNMVNNFIHFYRQSKRQRMFECMCSHSLTHSFT